VEIPEQQQVFTDDEEEQDLNEQLNKEKEFLKAREPEFIPEEKFKDMGILFGMPEAEVQAIAEEQKSKIQKFKDESALFGDVNVQEFSEPKAAEVQNEHIMDQSKEDVDMQQEKSFEIEVAQVPAEP
jgi:hypothetical protein